MKMKKFIALLGVTVLALTGCGSTTETASSSASITAESANWEEIEPASEIVFWSTKEDCYQELLDEFYAETGIKVSATYMGGYDDMVNKVMAGISGNNLPNVCQLGQRHGIAQMYDSGYLLAIEDYLDEELLDDIFDGFWKRFTYKDKKVIVPFQNSMPVLYYNKTLFEENNYAIPTTFEEVVSTAKSIKDDTGLYGFSMANDYPWYVLALLYNSEVTPVVEQKGCINTDASVKIIEAISKMATEDKSMPANQHATAKEDFCNGNIAMFMSSCASYKKFQGLVGDNFELGIAQFPAVTTMDIPMGGNGLGIFKSTPEEEKAATMFITFMLDKERIANNTLDSGYIPVTNAAVSTETYQTYLEDPNRQVVDKQLQYLGGAGVNPTDSLVWTEINALIDSVEANSGVDIPAALAEIDKKIDNYLAQYAGN